MTSARTTISRGALLVALMAGSSALAGGAAYADVLGGAGPVPLPSPLPTLPLLTDASPSPSPSPTTSAGEPAPAPEQQPASTPADAPAPADANPAPAAEGSSAAATSSTSTTGDVGARAATVPAPVAAPVAAPVTETSAISHSTTRVPPVAAPVAGPALAPSAAGAVAAAPAVGVPHAAARVDLLDGSTTNALGSFSGFPQLTVGSLQLPALPSLPGLRPLIAPDSSTQLPQLLAGGPSSVQLPVVRTGHSAPMQPGSTGIVLFVMASAAGAAGLARVRMHRVRIIRR